MVNKKEDKNEIKDVIKVEIKDEGNNNILIDNDKNKK